MTAPQKRFETYAEFWPFYMQEHSKPATQALHVAGTIMGIVLAIFLIADGHAWYALLCPIVGYGFAWYSHFFIQKNRPATFQYPLWSFISDFKMAYLFLIGKL